MFYLRLIAGVLGFAAAVIRGAADLLLGRDRASVVRDTARRMSRWICAPAGIAVRVHGREHLHAHRPCVYVANHQSYLDYAILAGIFPDGTAVVGKREMRHIPLVGWLFAATGNVLIDRERGRRAHETLAEVADAVRAGRRIWIFPEGTRGHGDGSLLPFKSGAFRLAALTGAPIVPVVVSPLKPWYDLRGRRAIPALVTVTVLPPIAPAAGAEPLALLRATHERMSRALAASRTVARHAAAA